MATSMSNKRFLVLVNPSSHGGRARRRWREFARRLPDYDCVILRDIAEARQLAQRASGYQTVVAVGGDGTISAVADGVLRNPDPALSLGVLYAGTSPDFCKFHGIPYDRSSVEFLLRAKIHEIPVLQVNGVHFFGACNLGIGAEVARLANRLRPRLGDRLGTFCALFWTLLRAHRRTFLLNGERLDACNHLLVTRMNYLASGLKLALPPLADNEFVVWQLCGESFLGMLRTVFRLYRGRPCGTVRVFAGPLRVESPEAVALEFDGDPQGTLPAEITVAPRRLRLLK